MPAQRIIHFEINTVTGTTIFKKPKATIYLTNLTRILENKGNIIELGSKIRSTYLNEIDDVENKIQHFM